ncbi:hypothetical protein ACP4OV_009112 [Aristida adscensionis]
MEDATGCSGGMAVASRSAVQGGKMTTSAAAADEEPAVAAPPVPLVSVVGGAVLEPLPLDDDDDEEGMVLGQDGDVQLADEPLGGDEDGVVYDEEHDGGYDEEADDPVEFWDGELPRTAAQTLRRRRCWCFLGV